MTVGDRNHARSTGLPATAAPVPSRRGRPRLGDARLSREKVLDVAERLIEECGDEKLSMRRVAVELGVDPMSLYNHVANKDALLDGIAERLLTTIDVPALTGDLDTDVWAMARSFRAAAVSRPRAAMLLLTRQLGSYTGLAATEAVLAILAGAGLAPEQAVHVLRSLFAYLVGTVLREVAIGPTFGEHSIGELAERPSDLEDAGLSYTARAAQHLASIDHDEEFDHGVRLMLAGLRAVRR